MKLTYDPTRNIAYIALRERPPGTSGSTPVETIRLSDELNIDIAPDGSVYGIELLNANAQLTGDGRTQTIAFVNEANGQRSEIKLAG